MTSQIQGETVTPSRAGKRETAGYVLLEYGLFMVVGVLVALAVWVNLWVAYWNGGNALMERFSADAEFALAAAAIFTLGLDIRKRRYDRQYEESRSPPTQVIVGRAEDLYK